MIENINIERLKNTAFSDVESFKKQINTITDKQVKQINNKEILKNMLSLLDITTLKDDDYKLSLEKIVAQTEYTIDNIRGYVAGLCVYSNLLPILNELYVPKQVKKVCVSGGFPTAQLSLNGKLNDIGFALDNAADEIDVPINRGLFYENKDELALELKAMRRIIDTKPLVKFKVIIESGELHSYLDVYSASIMAMQCGADFVKTSSGKVSRGADIYSSSVIMMAIKDFMQQNHAKKIGFKVAGGVKTCEQVLQYYSLMLYFFGEKYICKDTMRIGCSNLINEIINYLK